MFARINKIKLWQAILVITVAGFAAYCHGLHNPFLGDDIDQIVNNLPVHSISHIRLFFEGGTFYNGGGLAPLSGIYYRPMMTTVFSLIYTLFGPHPLYFHLIQMLLCIGTTIILYQFFRYSFKPALALFLSLVFLLHPIDSQVVYAIPDMQDALFVFFGMLALYLLFRYKSVRSLWAVSACLFLSLLSKESGVLFVAMALLYLFWFNRKRLYAFMAYIAVPIIIWLVLKINAVGLATASHNGPVDALSLTGRLMTAPSIILFYLSKFVFPYKLASGYFWEHPNFNIRYVLIPLVIDLAVMALVIYTAIALRKKTARTKYLSFLFFAIWSALGLLAVIQIFPLDFTAFEPWFYFPMIGFLGMIGTVISVYSAAIHIDRRLVTALALLLLIALGIRTELRAHDYSSTYVLAAHDIAASPSDYNAYYNLAGALILQDRFKQAEAYIRQSISLHPSYTNYYDYGLILGHLKEYAAAKAAYVKGLTYGDDSQIYEQLAELTLIGGNPSANDTFLNRALSKFPDDTKLWICLALFDQQHGNNTGAKAAVAEAENYGSVPQGLVTNIQNNLSFPLGIQDLDKTIQIQ